MSRPKSKRFEELLAPVMERGQLTARRLTMSDADGDDLFQEAVLRAFGKFASLRDEAAFPMWFYRILLSVHRSRSRTAFWKRHVALDEDIPMDAVVSEGGRRLRLALAKLPSVQREAVVLVEVDGHTVREVAEIQGVSASAVKSRLSRGRRRLRKLYERYEGTDIGARSSLGRSIGAVEQ